MRVLFCDSVVDNKVIDPDFADEYQCALDNGMSPSVISFEELEAGNINRALNFVGEETEEIIGLYRGWMLKPESYSNLYNGLLAKNIRLVNTPEQYRHCHYLPESYSIIESDTAKSVWMEVDGQVDFTTVFDIIGEFGDRPIIVKDYVKSEKHNWDDACYIPSASNRESVQSIVSKFIELRGSYLNEGLVFREFLELQELAIHSKSGMPLTLEYRLIFMNGKPVAELEYWDEGEYGVEFPDVKRFTSIASKVNSRFFTMDVAKTKSGEWIIMELGDGQVAGLPEYADKAKYYQELKNALQHGL